MLDEALIEALWQRAEPNVFIERDQFVADLKHYERTVLEPKTNPAFVFLIKGPEFHFMSLGTKQPMTMTFIREFLGSLIKQHGFACTKTPVLDKRQQRFNEKIGFYKTNEDEYDIHYRIDNVRF